MAVGQFPAGSGNHYTPFTLLVAYIPPYFGAVAPPDNLANSTTVFRITPVSLTKYVIRGVGFRTYIPSGDTVYARDGGPLWKWSVDHFERATADEEKKDHRRARVPYPTRSSGFQLFARLVREAQLNWLARKVRN
jgi:hypothetical protein